jgi:hypothetical protein
MRYSLKELQEMTRDLAHEVGIRTPAALTLRTRDARTGGCEVVVKYGEGQGWVSYGISGTRGEVGAQLTTAIRFCKERQEATDRALALMAEAKQGITITAAQLEILRSDFAIMEDRAGLGSRRSDQGERQRHEFRTAAAEVRSILFPVKS